MGVEFGGEEHEEAIAKVLAACQKAGKAAGIYCACPMLPFNKS